MEFKVYAQEKAPGILVVNVRGRLDTATTPEFEHELKALHSGIKVLIIDLKELHYISSLGVHALFQAHKKITLAKGSVTIANVQPQVLKVLEIANILPEPGSFQSIEEMDAYLDAIQKGTKK
jgi:anti-sigma B factor antagonist